MPLAFHADRQAMFDQQYRTASEYIVPYVRKHLDLKGALVLDIGCGDGGVLKAFAEIGCRGVGIDLRPQRTAFATEALKDAGLGEAVEFMAGDIHDDAVGGHWISRFDLVILKDVIEHVPEKERLMARIRQFLKPGGLVFFGFPPWRMPFGGHQQVSSSKLGKTPYGHLIPGGLYKSILESLGESEATVAELSAIRETRISISGFERLARKTGFEIVERTHFLFNPIYEYKFGIAPRKQFAVVRAMPGIRDFVTTACYYLLSAKSSKLAS